MASFTSISYSDIVQFLTIYNQKIPLDKNEAYDIAWELIINNPGMNIPVPSIDDFVIAYYFLENNIVLPRYKTSDILFTPDKDLIYLSDQLNLPLVDKERMIRILGYIGSLDNDISIYDLLPDEILANILVKLDCKTITLFCLLSKRFNKFCSTDKYTELLRTKIWEKIKLDTRNYDKYQLHRLCLNLNHKIFLSITCYNKPRSFIINDKNQVYGFGSNQGGQLGFFEQADVFLHKYKDVLSPKLIPNLNNIIQVCYNNDVSFFLDNYGEIYYIHMDRYLEKHGDGYRGRYRLDIKKFPNIPNIAQIAITHNYLFMLDNQGDIYSAELNKIIDGMGDEKDISNLVLGGNNIIQISVGNNHVLALNNNGIVYSFSVGSENRDDNNYGQLGLGNNFPNFIVENFNPKIIQNIDNIIQVSTGNTHSLVLHSQGYVYSFGNNNFGQLGIQKDLDREIEGRDDITGNPIITTADYKEIPVLIPTLNNIIQISTGYNYSLALNDQGQVYYFGNGIYTPTLIPELNNIIEINSGLSHWMALDISGYAYSSGENDHGELGLGNKVSTEVPKLIPNFNIF
jgi:alpha-tubulin suppressor-like RCC1 family protein